MIFETPTQHDYEAGVEVRSLLSTEVMEEIAGRLAVTDVDSSGQRLVKFWIDDFPSSPAEEYARARGSQQCPRQFLLSLFLVKEVQNQGCHIRLRGERASPLDTPQDLRVLLSMAAPVSVLVLLQCSTKQLVWRGTPRDWKLSNILINNLGRASHLHFLRKIMYPKDVPCCPWSHCVTGSAKEQT